MPNVMAALPNTGIMCYSVRWGPAVLKDVAMATNFGTNRGLLLLTGFVWPSERHNPNGISIGSAVFAGFTSVTDRQTTLFGR